jgi:hypothetical protein
MSKGQRLIEPDINDAYTSRTSIVEGQNINASTIAPFLNEKGVSLQEAYTEIGGFGKLIIESINRSLSFIGFGPIDLRIYFRLVHHLATWLLGTSTIVFML